MIVNVPIVFWVWRDCLQLSECC